MLMPRLIDAVDKKLFIAKMKAESEAWRKLLQDKREFTKIDKTTGQITISPEIKQVLVQLLGKDKGKIFYNIITESSKYGVIFLTSKDGAKQPIPAKFILDRLGYIKLKPTTAYLKIKNPVTLKDDSIKKVLGILQNASEIKIDWSKLLGISISQGLPTIDGVNWIPDGGNTYVPDSTPSTTGGGSGEYGTISQGLSSGDSQTIQDAVDCIRNAKFHVSSILGVPLTWSICISASCADKVEALISIIGIISEIVLAALLGNPITINGITFAAISGLFTLTGTAAVVVGAFMIALGLYGLEIGTMYEIERMAGVDPICLTGLFAFPEILPVITPQF